MEPTTERLNLDITTSSGNLHAQVEVPTHFIPVTSIVPVIRSLGEQAQDLEIAKTLKRGKTISCQKGCAACCRMMIPVSPPEAFALVEAIRGLTPEHQARIGQNLGETQRRFQEAGLFSTLQDLAESSYQLSDNDFQAINHAYYALRLPCVFLENEVCSIYEHRPAGCRSHLVSSPAEWCQEMEQHPVQELHIPLRAGTILSMLWKELTGGPLRLIPLPIAITWAESHQSQNQQTWKGMEIFNRALEGLEKYLHQMLNTASIPHPEKKREDRDSP